MNENLPYHEVKDDLLISYLLKEVSESEAQKVEQWRMISKENEKHFQQFSMIWESAKNMGSPEHLDARDSLKRLKEKAALQKQQQRKIIRLKQNWIKIAAALFIIAGCAWLFNQRQPAQLELATKEKVTTQTLSDGSVVTLNRNTLLTYPKRFIGGRRQVDLPEGEAFFSIKPDKSKPFLIYAGSTTIKVVGTSFNVKNKAGIVEVIVETGIVEVTRNKNVLRLHPGEKVTVQKTVQQLNRQKTPDQLYSYYRSKEFIADDTPLWRVVQVLNEAYDSQIIIGNKTLNNLQLNTTFRNESLDDILNVISHTFNIKVERKRNQIILY